MDLRSKYRVWLGHPAIIRILANNPDLSKILLGYPTIIKILANSSNS